MSDSDLSNEEVKALVKQRLEKTSKRVGMLAFSQGDHSTPRGVNNNGTVSFVQLPERKVLITNHHVWDTFREHRENDPTYRLVLTGTGFVRPLDLSDAIVISQDRDLDLCVLSYPPDDVEALDKEFALIPRWPPLRPKSGDEVLITGYPGMRRTVDTMLHPQLNRTVEVLRHESVLLGLHVEAISDRQSRLAFTNPNREVIQLSEKPIDEFRWGGMSGSLVYCPDPDEDRLVPCGILHAAGEGLDARFLSTHLDFVQSDGSISITGF